MNPHTAAYSGQVQLLNRFPWGAIWKLHSFSWWLNLQLYALLEIRYQSSWKWALMYVFSSQILKLQSWTYFSCLARPHSNCWICWICCTLSRKWSISGQKELSMGFTQIKPRDSSHQKKRFIMLNKNIALVSDPWPFIIRIQLFWQ